MSFVVKMSKLEPRFFPIELRYHAQAIRSDVIWHPAPSQPDSYADVAANTAMVKPEPDQLVATLFSRELDMSVPVIWSDVLDFGGVDQALAVGREQLRFRTVSYMWVCSSLY
jgi:hypothetical protein